VALDVAGQLVGKDDLAAQTEQVYLNLGAALKAAGATYADVAKLTAYVPNWTPDKMQPLVAGAMRAAARIGFDAERAMTLIGVASLAQPEFLIEIEAVATIGEGV
jgi:enamine deaminase RidA (YjgF/YER057c/UK114 family)